LLLRGRGGAADDGSRNTRREERARGGLLSILSKRKRAESINEALDELRVGSPSGTILSISMEEGR
jgi:hypothetical protein